MVLGAMVVGGMVGRATSRRQFEAMSQAQAQQAQLNEAKAQAAQAQQAARAAQAQAAQAADQPKKDTFQELEKIASLKQQGILTEEEFQKMKARLISSM